MHFLGTRIVKISPSLNVNANVYKKLINSDKQVRFAKRFIYDSYLYRKAKKASEEG